MGISGKNTMLAGERCLRDRGIRADTILREIASAAGGRGGKPLRRRVSRRRTMASAVAGDYSQHLDATA
jgi:hypothetical protein